MNNKTFAEINLDNLVYNLRGIQRHVTPSQIIPVVKADAYGHGAVTICRRLVKEGVHFFAVARLEEALEIRESGLTQPVLIFGRLFPTEIPIAVKAGFRITLFGREDVRWIENAGPDSPANVHVNIDTGMGRIGVFYDRNPEFFNDLIQSKYCVWEGLYSHFATADEKDKSYAGRQLDRFREIAACLRKIGAKPDILHMANSGAILDIPESYFDAVRPGILLYGHYPSDKTSRALKIKQVMTLKTYVAHARRVPAGQSISYGRRWKSEKETTIAVLPIGYADGIRRDLTNKGEVLIRGKPYPMVGTVTMDYIMVDMGDDPVHPGDEVIIWGDSSQGSIQVSDVAAGIGTIPYELTCGISRRVRRVYLGI